MLTPTSRLVTRWYGGTCSPSHANRCAYLHPQPRQCTVDQCLLSMFKLSRHSVTNVWSIFNHGSIYFNSWAVPHFEAFTQPTAEAKFCTRYLIYNNVLHTVTCGYQCLPLLINHTVPMLTFTGKIQCIHSQTCSSVFTSIDQAYLYLSSLSRINCTHFHTCPSMPAFFDGTWSMEGDQLTHRELHDTETVCSI